MLSANRDNCLVTRVILCFVCSSWGDPTPTGLSQVLARGKGAQKCGGKGQGILVVSSVAHLAMTGQVMEAALQQRYAGTATIPSTRYVC